MLYFAYGSNLNHFQMKRRCKDSKYLKKINLKNFRLTFRSKYRAADIEPKKNSFVGKPDNINPEITDVGPGICVILILFSKHSFTSLKPGSDIKGVPASETKA